MIIMLGLSKLTDESTESFNKDYPQKEFIKELCVIKRSERFSSGSAAAQEEPSLILKHHGALEDTCHAKRRKEFDFVTSLLLVSCGTPFVFSDTSPGIRPHN